MSYGRVCQADLPPSNLLPSTASLRKQDPDIDAIFFTGDVMAVGAEQECLCRGRKVPDRIAIVGFDDQEIAAEAVPPPKTVRVAREEIGRMAAHMLLERLHGKTLDSEIVDVGFRLIERDSA
jgi:LacI family transcriptional regulator, gluconate utilization system Gnt-I transcriptional repressor